LLWISYQFWCLWFIPTDKKVVGDLCAFFVPCKWYASQVQSHRTNLLYVASTLSVDTKPLVEPIGIGSMIRIL
jgi:hypothetical protein